jgi:uncharacterized protein
VSVPLHYHFVGSYHASGTDDRRDGQGNYAAVERAKELDLGVIIIRLFDKGWENVPTVETILSSFGTMQWSPFVFPSTWLVVSSLAS